MRFHHSTRRGRNRLGQHQANNRYSQHSASSTSRWSQLGYCRETNIHFNRRTPIEPVQADTLRVVSFADSEIEDENLIQMTNPSARSAAKRRSTRAKQLNDNGGQQQQEQQQYQTHIGERLNRLSLREARHKQRENERNNAAGADGERQVTLETEPIRLSDFAASAKKLDLEGARAKLIAQVEKHPFWSNKAARKMQLTSLEERRVYVYELVSYCERRELEWRYESYKGGPIGASVPFTRTLVAESASQPATPTRAKLSATGSLRTGSQQARVTIPARSQLVASPKLSASGACSPTASTTVSADSFWTKTSAGSGAGTGNGSKAATPPGEHLAARSSIRRSISSSVSAPCSAGAAQPEKSLYEPLSAIERPMPSAELIWSIEVPEQVRPAAFVGYLHSSELANSSFVKRCHGCQGRGRLKCAACYGVGFEVCLACSGKGTTRSLSTSGSDRYGANRYGAGASYANSDSGFSSRNAASPTADTSQVSAFSIDNSCRTRGAGEPGGITQSGSAWVTDTCHNCHGAGQKRCWTCAGKSYNNCLGCLGSGKLRCFLNLNVTWTNHRDEATLNNADGIIPRDRLKLSSGLQLAEQVGDRLKAFRCEQVDGTTGGGRRFNETDQLYLASKRLLEKHNQAYKQEKLLKQRHKVTQIECYVVNYEWKQRRGHFVVYGDERKVYIAKYPFKSLCNIT